MKTQRVFNVALFDQRYQRKCLRKNRMPGRTKIFSSWVLDSRVVYLRIRGRWTGRGSFGSRVGRVQRSSVATRIALGALRWNGSNRSRSNVFSNFSSWFANLYPRKSQASRPNSGDSA